MRNWISSQVRYWTDVSYLQPLSDPLQPILGSEVHGEYEIQEFRGQ